MKILHICETATGGIATYFRLFAKAAPCGSQSVFLVPERQAGQFEGALKLFTYRGGRTPRGLHAMIQAMHRAIREEKPDVVFFHSTFSLLALFDLALVRRHRVDLPTLYCPHGWSISRVRKPGSLHARLMRRLEGSLAGLATRVINISAHDARLAEALGYRGRHVVVENAVADHSAPANAAPFIKRPGEIHLLFVGRFDRQKGVDLLLEAYKDASKARTDLRLHLVGGQVLGDQSIDLPPNAHYAGWVGPEAIDAWYAAADALVVPSRWEGFGLVVPEAYRNATPVLVSDNGALPDLVEPGETGIVVALDRLADTLRDLDGDELAAMRPRARALFEKRFTDQRWADAMCRVIEDVTSKVAA